MSADDHGSASTYTNHKCRCDECRRAWAECVQRRKIDRAGILAEDPTAAEHGKETTYSNWSCRCDPCTEARRIADRARRERRRAS